MWLSWLGIVPQMERSPVPFPVRAHAWVAGSVLCPLSAVLTGGNQSTLLSHVDVSLSPSLPLSLK